MIYSLSDYLSNDKFKLSHKLASAAAITAAFVAAPFITSIDVSVTQVASGKLPNIRQALFTQLKSIVSIKQSMFATLPYWMVLFVYGSTYLTNNNIKEYCANNHIDPTYYGLIGTSMVNMTAGIIKDAIIAVREGKKPALNEPKKSYPARSLAMFFVRDVCTIGAGFTLPPIFTSYLVRHNYLGKDIAPIVSSLTIPAVCQLVITPLHLLALDYYNNQDATTSFKQRCLVVKDNMRRLIVTRLGRVFFAYGVAYICNAKLWEYLKQYK